MIHYADASFQSLLAPHGAALAGRTLADALGERLSRADRADLEKHVAAGRPKVVGLALRNGGRDALRLTLTPTPLEDIWVGALSRHTVPIDIDLGEAAVDAALAETTGEHAVPAHPKPRANGAASTDLRTVRELEAQIARITHREQERIGRELHDGLGQELTGAALLMKAVEQRIEHEAPELQAQIRAVREAMERCIGATRAVAQTLAPPALDGADFAETLQRLATGSEALYGVPVVFSADAHGRTPERHVATELYRIAQEAIRNAARHSGARRITLRLASSGDRLEVSIEDDGRGMPASAERAGGMGLRIMHHRAASIGASLEIAPRRRGGTVVRCILGHTAHDAAAARLQ